MISFLKETKPERDAIVFFKVRKNIPLPLNSILSKNDL